MTNNNEIEQRIVCEAKRLFVENGYQDTSMSQIAEAAGLTRPALHYYFNTKEKLFGSVFASVIGSFIPHIEEILTADRPISERLNILVDAIIDYLRENPSAPLFFMREAIRDSRYFVEILGQMGLKQRFIRIGQHLKEEMVQGKIKPTPIHVVVFAFYGQLLGPFVLRNIVNPVLVPSEEEFDKLMTEWKSYFVSQMEYLLLPDEKK